MVDAWDDSELSACVRTYLWMLKAGAAGYKPNKTRIREAMIGGPLSERTHGAVELRFQNISAVLDAEGQPWIQGYKPRKNVGGRVASKIQEFIDQYRVSRSAKRTDWIVNALPIETVQRAADELASGIDFEYPESSGYDVVTINGLLAPKRVIGYACLLNYGAPLFSSHFSSGDRHGAFRKLIEAGYEVQNKDLDGPESESFRREVQRYKKQAGGKPPVGNRNPKKKSSESSSYERDPEVVAFVEERAGGICELCGEPAPFNRPDGTPYLEIHHIEPLGEGGSDVVENAAGICPNCHRSCHHGVDADELQKALFEKAF